MDNPLEQPFVLALLAARLGAAGLASLRAIGTLAPRGKVSVAPGAAHGTCFLGSAARRAVNEAVRGVRVSAAQHHLD